MSTVMDGKLIKNNILNELKNLDNSNLGLAVIQIDETFAGDLYVKQKRQMAFELEINFELFKLDISSTEEEVLDVIESCNNNPRFSGILLQMPIPKHLDYDVLVNAIDVKKDVDGLNPNSSFLPCTVLGIIKLLEYYKINYVNKNVVIIGKSKIIGEPLAKYFEDNNVKVLVCDSKTVDLKKETLKADILISAVGKPKLVREDMVASGAVLIDVGISYVNGKTVGDIDFDKLKAKCSYITPTPGGVGPMTIAGLALNIFKDI